MRTSEARGGFDEPTVTGARASSGSCCCATGCGPVGAAGEGGPDRIAGYARIGCVYWPVLVKSSAVLWPVATEVWLHPLAFWSLL